jgi:hypothetical protein
MPSPFPGMDPYLETNWRDVHASLIVDGRNQIARQLLKGLKARAQEYLVVYPVVEDEQLERRLARIASDVQVREPRPSTFAAHDSVAIDGGYEDINYAHEPIPDIPLVDAKWAEEWLTQHGKR